VLGPPGTTSEVGEPTSMHTECLLRSSVGGSVTVHLRFLQLQQREVERYDDGGFVPVPELRAGVERWIGWDEAVPHELAFGPFPLGTHETVDLHVPSGEDIEPVHDRDLSMIGRLRRRRRALRAELIVGIDDLGDALHRVSLTVTNTDSATGDDVARSRDDASASSFLGAHVLLEAHQAFFVSLLDPPDEASVVAAAQCRNQRCWPVLASPDDDLVMVSPIILYDHPELAPESDGELFDATEIDEILTLRVMTMTDEEKAEARATDPKAAAIIDRCDAMSDDTLTSLHGRLRNPHAEAIPSTVADDFAFPTLYDDRTFDGQTIHNETMAQVPTWSDPVAGKIGGDKPWWDPGVDGSVDPDRDHVVVSGVRVSKGSQVRVMPRRRADAQDMFFTGMRARVTAIFGDVDGNDHVAVVLIDDPAADLQEASGRFLYFAPDEIEPLDSLDVKNATDMIDMTERHRAGKEG
jgi:hypothetical protein